MEHVSISEFKARLSEYLHRVEEGETLVLTRHGKPIIEVTARRAKTIDLFGCLAGKAPPLGPDIGPGSDPDTLAAFEEGEAEDDHFFR